MSAATLTASDFHLALQGAVAADILVRDGKCASNDARARISRVQTHMDTIGERDDLIDAAASVLAMMQDHPWLQSCRIECSRTAAIGDEGQSYWDYSASVSRVRFVGGKPPGSGAPDDELPGSAHDAEEILDDWARDEDYDLGAILRINGDTEEVFTVSRAALAAVLAVTPASAAAAARVLWRAEMNARNRTLLAAAKPAPARRAKAPPPADAQAAAA